MATAVIDAIELVDWEPDCTFNLNVEPCHNYFAEGLLVANCIDDGNKPPTDADPIGDSNATLRSTAAWFREILPDRLNSLERSAIINIQQRVSDLDISGIILDLALEYDFLSIPMLLNTLPDKAGNRIPVIPSSIGWIDPRLREDWWVVEGDEANGIEADNEYDPLGEVVAEDEQVERDGTPADLVRFPLAQLDQLRQAKGSYAWASQYQQTVSPRGGGIIREEWWQNWLSDEFPEFGTCIASLDTAYKQHEEADYNALTIWSAFEHPESGKPKLMVRAAWQVRASLADLVDRQCVPRCGAVGTSAERKQCNCIIGSLRQHQVDTLLIEDSARGPDVAHEIVRLMYRNECIVTLVPPVSDKVARLHACVPIFENGIVYAPITGWADELIKEVSGFPRRSHDDLVDTVSMALIYLRKTGVATRREEHDEEVLSRRRYRREPEPVYPA